MDNGTIAEMRPRRLLYYCSRHNSWVIGDEPWKFFSADHYATIPERSRSNERSSTRALEREIGEHDVVLFMKGTPVFP
jgi:hypothetical protein